MAELGSATAIDGCRTTRIYCRPGCPAGRRMKPENRVHFRSREEAKATGYRACKVCKPDTQDAELETLFLTRYPSPLGAYIIVTSQRGVVCVAPEEKTRAHLARWGKAVVEIRDGSGHGDTLAHELAAYFSRRLRHFSVPLDLRGTSFQRQVWELLNAISYGETRSYRQLAQALGRPNAARAVGRAIGSNPVAIVVPCHRVIGADGSLTGYAGGLERKQALLELEAAAVGRAPVWHR